MLQIMKTYFEGSEKQGGLEGACHTALWSGSHFCTSFVSRLIGDESLHANGGGTGGVIFRHEVTS